MRWDRFSVPHAVVPDAMEKLSAFALLCLLVRMDISGAQTVSIIVSPSPSLHSVTSALYLPPTSHPNLDPNGTFSGGNLSEGEILLVITITLPVVFVVCVTVALLIASLCYCRKKRRDLWKKNPRIKREEKNTKEMCPPDPQVSLNSRFHAGDMPLLMRQDANQTSGGQYNTYLGAIADDGLSGMIALSKNDSMSSSPPSPTVSIYEGYDDAPHFYGKELSHNSNKRIAPSMFGFSLDQNREGSFVHEQLYTNRHHMRENSNFSHSPSSSHSDLSNLGNSNMLSEPVAIGHSGHKGLGLHGKYGGRVSLHNYYDERHPWKHTPSSHHSYSDNSHHPSGYHRNSLNDPHPPIIDSILLEVVGCLMHQENCHIPQCPCREVKRRFAHIMPNTKLHIQRETEGVTEDIQTRRLDLINRRKQMRLPLSSQNFSPGIHSHYHLTSRPHIGQTSGRMNRPRSIQRRRSKSMDLAPKMGQPEEADALIPDGTRDLLHSPTFSPAAMRGLPPTTPSTPPVAPSVFLREISLSADNLPTLCLNDCPISATPLSDNSNGNLEASKDKQEVQNGNSATSSETHTLDQANDMNFNKPEHTNQKGVYIFCGDCPIPKYMTTISTLSDCNSEGKQFTNEANDFSLEIPQGAIPEGERLTVDVGVALSGPFQFPEGLRPVSPVFWACVRDNAKFQFSKPVTVTIPHFLDLENDEDIKSLGLTFLKANHSKNSDGLYQFRPTDGEMDFEPSQTFGVLNTTHFCSLCIACRDRPDVLTRTSFCITSVLPQCATIGKKQNAFFFITFYNLRTCLAKVDELIVQKKLEQHEKTQVKFNFKRFTKNPALEMIMTQPKHGRVGMIGVKKV